MTRSRSAAPPLPSLQESRIWLSETVVPTAGAQLAAAVVNTTGKGMSFGVLGTFERWTGIAWAPNGDWPTSLDQWGGFPVAGGANVGAKLINMGASAHGVGPVQYFSLPALSKGWYRVGYSFHYRPPVYGVVRVDPAAPKSVPIDNPGMPTLVAYPTLMRTSRVIGLVALPSHGGAEEVEFQQQLTTSVTIQRCESEGWMTLASREVHPANPPLANVHQVAVTLPDDLPSGAYRLLRHSPTAGDLARVVWIDHSLPSTADI